MVTTKTTVHIMCINNASIEDVIMMTYATLLHYTTMMYRLYLREAMHAESRQLCKYSYTLPLLL